MQKIRHVFQSPLSHTSHTPYQNCVWTLELKKLHSVGCACLSEDRCNPWGDQTADYFTVSANLQTAGKAQDISVLVVMMKTPAVHTCCTLDFILSGAYNMCCNITGCLLALRQTDSKNVDIQRTTISKQSADTPVLQASSLAPWSCQWGNLCMHRCTPHWCHRMDRTRLHTCRSTGRSVW